MINEILLNVVNAPTVAVVETTTVDVATELVNSVGVPVAVIIACFWYIVQKDKNNATERIAWTETAKETAKALENNTLVMHQILTVLQLQSKEEDK